MNELLVQLQMKMEAFQKDAALQAEKGNKAAGQRARCVSLEMEPLLKQFRKLSLAASKDKIKNFTWLPFIGNEKTRGPDAIHPCALGPFVASVNHVFLSHFFPNQFYFGMGQLGKLYLFQTLLLVSLHFVDEHLPVVKELLTATVLLINFFGGFQYLSGTAVIPLEHNSRNLVVEAISQ